MSRLLQIFLVSLTLITATFAQDREVTSRDLNGVPKSHKYGWAIVGGTLLGIGVGVIAPGGNKSAVKGALIGGSLTSMIYLYKSPRAAYGKRRWAHLITNTVLGTSVLWTICDCKTGAWAGAFIGGGGTAVIQAFGSGRSGIASLTGTNADHSVSAQNSTAEGSVRAQSSIDFETIVMAPGKSVSNASPGTLTNDDSDLVASDDNNLVGKDRGAVAHEKKQLESRK